MHLPLHKPLEDIAIDFGYEPIMGRACAVHFIAGVNGSGKSRLMRALAEIFLFLEQGKELPFPVTLVYDWGEDSENELDIWLDDLEEGTPGDGVEARVRNLPKHTIFLHKPQEGPTHLVYFYYVPPNLPRPLEERHPWPLLEEITAAAWEEIDERVKNGPLQSQMLEDLLRKMYAAQSENETPAEEPVPEKLPSFLAKYYVHSYRYPGKVPSDTGFLPEVLLAYSSGTQEEWESLFALSAINTTQEMLAALFNEREDKPDSYERPRHWDAFQEADLLRRQGQEIIVIDGPDQLQSEELEITSPQSKMGIFITPKALKLATCAVILQQTLEEFPSTQNERGRQVFLAEIKRWKQEGKRVSGPRGILNEIDWLWPVTLSLKLAFYPERYSPVQCLRLLRLYEAATTVLKEPAPSQMRHLHFDLTAMQSNADGQPISTLQALINALTNLNPQEDNAQAQEQAEGVQTLATPLDIFRQLWDLQREHILDDVSIALRKRTATDLILYESLSDGEQAYLGRMALFYLLQGAKNAIILLDEPETHFNDYWKREMVDIIDNSLQNDSVEVLLSTHSSIALSDAFESEIVFLYKDPLAGSVSTYELPINSFGASPIDIMRDVFQAPEGVGQRAAEFLDLVLMMALYPDEVETIWNADKEGTSVEELLTLQVSQELCEQLKERITYAYAFRKDADIKASFDTLFLRTIQTVHRYTQKVRKKRQITITDALAILYERLGPGYYQFEFRRRLRELRRDSNAAQN